MIVSALAHRLTVNSVLCAYLPMAMRRVYGGGRAATATRYLVLMLLHGVGLLLAITAAAGSAIVTA
jgi:hypothetical protein